ncbi:protein kinase [Streptomyces sp. NPDC016845]|uniref:protein kinase domain-containing protein n=1 Tax=Streptomyces sp. NPDC016845 TaxID=3364972 RepID=UPI003798AC57
MPRPLAHDDPATLGPYRLIARLGSGGMGTVYVARSAGGRTVALKTMHPGIAEDPAARTRFRLEVDAARVIGGQFGAKVFDADPLAVPTPWFATEYVLGPALDEAVEAVGPLPEQAVRALGAALCTALGQLHRSEVVHRDLKPSNLLVTAYGPKVIDFGIARAIGDDRLTRTGSAVGTPAFMSPEQATGLEHGPAGDVFAMAGVLVYAARGSGPFGRGQAADLLYRVRYSEPDLTGVPAALVPVLAQCLHKDPARRPTTEQLAAHLHDGRGEFVDHLPAGLLAELGRRAADVWQLRPQRLPAPQVAAETAPATPTSTKTRSSRRAFLAGGVAVAAAVAGGGTWWWRSAQAESGGGNGKGTNGPVQTRNLDPVWENEQASYLIYGYGPAVPFAVEGDIHVPFRAVTLRFNPDSGLRKEDIRADCCPWQTQAVNGTEYRLNRNFDTGARTPPAGVATWDEAQDYVHPTAGVLGGTNGGLDGNQLLRVSGTVAYVAVGAGKESSEGFLATQKFTLRAVDTDSGEQLWSKPLPARPDKSHRLHFLAAEVVGDRLVTLQETEPKTVRVVVRSTRTGDVLWDRPYGRVDDLIALLSDLAVDDGHLYLGGDRLRALRLTDGDETWATKAGRAYSPPMVVSGVVYAVGQDAGLTAVSADDGSVAWTERSTELSRVSLAWRPVIGKRYGYYRNGVQLHAIDLRTHRIARTYKTRATRFYVDTPDRFVLGMGETTMSAYPLS